MAWRDWGIHEQSQSYKIWGSDGSEYLFWAVTPYGHINGYQQFWLNILPPFSDLQGFSNSSEILVSIGYSRPMASQPRRSPSNPSHVSRSWHSYKSYPKLYISILRSYTPHLFNVNLLQTKINYRKNWYILSSSL